MLVGHQIIQLLYTDKLLNEATGAAGTFASAFRNTLACCVGKYKIMMEWGIAANLDPREKLLGKLCHFFDTLCGIRWLVSCGGYWDSHEDFVTDVTNKVIKYAQDVADDYFKD